MACGLRAAESVRQESGERTESPHDRRGPAPPRPGSDVAGGGAKAAEPSDLRQHHQCSLAFTEYGFANAHHALAIRPLHREVGPTRSPLHVPHLHCWVVAPSETGAHQSIEEVVVLAAAEPRCRAEPGVEAADRASASRCTPVFALMPNRPRVSRSSARGSVSGSNDTASVASCWSGGSSMRPVTNVTPGALKAAESAAAQPGVTMMSSSMNATTSWRAARHPSCVPEKSLRSPRVSSARRACPHLTRRIVLDAESTTSTRPEGSLPCRAPRAAVEPAARSLVGTTTDSGGRC